MQIADLLNAVDAVRPRDAELLLVVDRTPADRRDLEKVLERLPGPRYVAAPGAADVHDLAVMSLYAGGTLVVEVAEHAELPPNVLSATRRACVVSPHWASTHPLTGVGPFWPDFPVRIGLSRGRVCLDVERETRTDWRAVADLLCSGGRPAEGDQLAARHHR